MVNYDVIIIGGGASGMLASIFASRNGLKVLVIDHNEKLGKKLFITGKGRCNLTNNSSVENHIENIITNPKFMYSALNQFTPSDTMKFFTDAGLRLKTERGNRVFPVSDKSSDVIKTLTNLMNNYGVKVVLDVEVNTVYKQNNIFHIRCNNNETYTSYSVVVATGGLSYSGTGSSDFGLRLASKFGHKIIIPRPALCPILVNDNIAGLNGLSLKNVELVVKSGKFNKSIRGEMMFTYNSITGPIVLTMSSLINKLKSSSIDMYIDLKPALTEEQLHAKIEREFIEFNKKSLKSYLVTLLPSRLVDFFMRKIRLENKKISDLNKNDILNLILGLKHFDLNIKSLDDINVAVVTSGGVDVKEINSKTCESKLIKGLYFIGEVLDVDALTGGYNLQIAWSTAYACVNNITGEK